MVLEKRWLYSIGNRAEIRPLEKGRKSSEMTLPVLSNKESSLITEVSICLALLLGVFLLASLPIDESPFCLGSCSCLLLLCLVLQ